MVGNEDDKSQVLELSKQTFDIERNVDRMKYYQSVKELQKEKKLETDHLAKLVVRNKRIQRRDFARKR